MDRIEFSARLKRELDSKKPLRTIIEYLEKVKEDKIEAAKKDLVDFAYGGEEAKIKVQRQVSEADGLEMAILELQEVLNQEK